MKWYDEEQDQEDEDVLFDDNVGVPIKYIMYRYFPKKTIANRHGTRVIRKSKWEKAPQTYSQKQLDSISPYYIQYGDVFKVRRCK